MPSRQPFVPLMAARDFICSKLIELMARTQASYSARSSVVNVPSVDLSAKFIQFFLHVRCGSQARNTSCNFRRQTSADRIKEFIDVGKCEGWIMGRF